MMISTFLLPFLFTFCNSWVLPSPWVIMFMPAGQMKCCNNFYPTVSNNCIGNLITWNIFFTSLTNCTKHGAILVLKMSKGLKYCLWKICKTSNPFLRMTNVLCLFQNPILLFYEIYPCPLGNSLVELVNCVTSQNLKLNSQK